MEPLVGASSYINCNNNSTNTSCYTTPFSSSPKVNMNKIPTMVKHLVKEGMPLSLGTSTSLNSTVAEFSTDPGFAERAAKLSCFGSRSFNGRTTQLSSPLVENGKKQLPIVSSSPSLKENNNSPLQDLMEVANSQEESAISEQTPNGDTGEKPSPYVNSRKRKGKSKETSTSTNPPMAAEASEDSNAKRNKPNKGEGNENGQVKAEEESKGCNNSNANDEKQSKSNSKLPEPPKDCIHVRARRGQATDSRSLAERGKSTIPQQVTTFQLQYTLNTNFFNTKEQKAKNTKEHKHLSSTWTNGFAYCNTMSVVLGHDNSEKGNTVACVMARQDATPDVRQCTTPFGRGHGDATEMQANGRGHDEVTADRNVKQTRKRELEHEVGVFMN
ncbi:Transcription factor bHLH78 [Glycine soja]